MSYFRTTGFSMLPEVVKNLLIINGLAYMAMLVLRANFGIELNQILGLHYWNSEHFKIYQVVTYMFMHGSHLHLFFNMFAVWMFGTAIENSLGPKRFLNFYLITGFGAAAIHYLTVHFQIIGLESAMTQDQIDLVMEKGAEIYANSQNFVDVQMGKLNSLYNTPVVGASGSLFGILLAFGMMFPNALMMMLFIPIPIKAKYFVMGYGIIELISGLQNNPADNVAHFAHLGGMIFGFILIKIWGIKRLN